MTPSEAIEGLRQGAAIIVEGLGAEPTALTECLAHESMASRELEVTIGYPFNASPLLNARHLRLRSWFSSGGLASQRRVEYMPLTWAQSYKYLSTRAFDAALVTVSPADEKGDHSLGISVGHTREMIRRAQLVIAQINPEMPRTNGASLHSSEIDVAVRAASPLLTYDAPRPKEIDIAVARNVARLVPDAATVQVGLGSIPDQVLHELARSGRRDLAVVGILTSGFRAIVEAGGCRAQKPQALVAEIVGDDDLYRWSKGNPYIEMAEVAETHFASSLRNVDDLIAINTAIEIDLYGQANVEMLEGLRFSGVGGSLDFAIAAQEIGGIYILALKSITAKGNSRIIPTLHPGPVSIPRNLVHIVATEHGIADLRWKTTEQRAMALIEIAHPSHRQALQRAWKEHRRG